MTIEALYYEALTGDGPFPGQAVEAASAEGPDSFCAPVRQARLEINTGLEEQSLSVREEHDLALLIQKGLAAQAAYPGEDISDTVRRGKTAELKLACRYLDLAESLALASMGIPTVEERTVPPKRWPAKRQGLVNRIPWLSSEFMDLRSPYASHEDRISVLTADWRGLCKSLRLGRN